MSGWEESNPGDDELDRTNMAAALESMKRGAVDPPANALNALAKDPRSCHNVYLAEKTHKRLGDKMKDQVAAKKYFAQAKAAYPYSAYFEGAKRDSK